MQNNRTLRSDEHKRALVNKGSELLKFNKLTLEQEAVLADANIYAQGEKADMILIT